MERATLRMAPESSIENVVAALMREINGAICTNILPGMIENGSIAVLKAFQMNPEISAT